MNCSQAKQIRIEDFLKSINVQPDKSRKAGTVIMYKSPFRNEKIASFEVNTGKNVWFDHGTGIGGNILDLVMKLKQTDLKGSLEFLSSGYFTPFSFYKQKTTASISRHKLEIISIKPITEPYLIKYLAERKISLRLANIYLKEITYKNWNSKINGYKIYRALGFKNDHNGYELRNKYFKGCTSKQYTTVSGINNKRLNIFEGFFDFLSAMVLSKTPQLKFDTLILNSTSVKQKTLQIIGKYEKLNLFMDNDQAGIETVSFYRKNHKSIQDLSVSLYPYHKDLNQYLITKNNNK